MTGWVVAVPIGVCVECLCPVPVTRDHRTARHWHRMPMHVDEWPSLANPPGIRTINRRLACPGNRQRAKGWDE